MLAEATMTIELQATSIGSLAAKLIRSPDFHGTITNTFTNSFYIKAANGDIIFFTSNATLSPITVNLSSSPNKLDPHQGFINKDGHIESRGVLIHVGGAQIYHPEVIPHNLNGLLQLGRTLETASFVLEILDTSNSVLDPCTPTHARTADFVKSAILPLQFDAAHDEFCDLAPSLVGLGPGFTPSGDDFLGGFLATYNTFAGSLKRPKILLSFDLLGTRTNWISAKLLDYMQSEILDDELAGLISSASKENGNPFIFSVESLVSRGHTSGIDLVTGVIVALSVVVDAERGSNLTTTMVERLNMHDTGND